MGTIDEISERLGILSRAVDTEIPELKSQINNIDIKLDKMINSISLISQNCSISERRGEDHEGRIRKLELNHVFITRNERYALWGSSAFIVILMIYFLAGLMGVQLPPLPI
jgi:hypothetical protein